MANIKYDHVWKRFGDVVAVQDLDIEVADKEFLVFVGPSGCGKTTSLRLLAGLEEISDGNIYISDRLVNDVPPKDRDIAMVFQSYALYPHMSVYDNMAFGLKLRKTPRSDIQRRVQEAADMLEIGNLLDRKPKQLSGGQRQRVAVGRAIVRDPAVFCMDEPLSNLDAKLRVSARATLSKLHQRLEATFIYVTHDQIEAMTMGTRIAVMDKGILQQIDTPQQLYDKPNNVFVGGFIGSPAMNFFAATLTTSDDKMFVDTGSFRVRVPEDKMDFYKPLAGKEAVFGIRPEDIHDPEYAPPNIQGSSIDGRVDVTELMGNEVIVYVVSGDHQYMARLDPRTGFRVGNDVQVVMNMNNMHIFDRETELAIRPK